jgi:hypothetical protein
MGESRE